MPIATIDVGTNTAKLLVADVHDGKLIPHYEERRYVRLGEGVDADAQIGEAAIERLTAALAAFHEVAVKHGVSAIHIGATSASRDARNRDEVISRVKHATGLDYHVLTGREEAALSFRGAISAFPDLQQPCTVVDIGGGSTEIVGGTPGEDTFDYQASVDVGSVRVTERCFTAQPPRREELEKAQALIKQALVEARIPAASDRILVGAAGTTGALARMHLDFARWADMQGRAVQMSRREVILWRLRLSTLTYEQTIALNPRVMAGRADIFLAGTLVLEGVMAHLDVDKLYISPRGLRHGLALQVLTGKG